MSSISLAGDENMVGIQLDHETRCLPCRRVKDSHPVAYLLLDSCWASTEKGGAYKLIKAQ